MPSGCVKIRCNEGIEYASGSTRIWPCETAATHPCRTLTARRRAGAPKMPGRAPNSLLDLFLLGLPVLQGKQLGRSETYQKGILTGPFHGTPLPSLLLRLHRNISFSRICLLRGGMCWFGRSYACQTRLPFVIQLSDGPLLAMASGGRALNCQKACSGRLSKGPYALGRPLAWQRADDCELCESGLHAHQPRQQNRQHACFKHPHFGMLALILTVLKRDYSRGYYNPGARAIEFVAHPWLVPLGRLGFRRTGSWSIDLGFRA